MEEMPGIQNNEVSNIYSNNKIVGNRLITKTTEGNAMFEYTLQHSLLIGNLYAYDEITFEGVARTCYLNEHSVLANDVMFTFFKTSKNVLIKNILNLGLIKVLNRDKYYLFKNKENNIYITLTDLKASVIYIKILYSHLTPYSFFLKCTKKLLNLKESQKSKENVEYKLSVLSSQNNNFYIKDININSKQWNLDFDINDNYNDETVEFYNDLKETLKDKMEGLVILQSDPGYGKTFLLRKFIKEFTDRKFLYLPSHMTPILEKPEFVDFCINNLAGRVVIIEDAEKVLRKRTDYTNSPVSTILNVSDGMLGDVLGITFIFTINCDFNEIDDALLRKGRIISKQTLKKLTIEKTNKLLNKLGHDFVSKEEMSLSDVYNFNSDDFSKKKKEPIGFIG